MAQNNIIVVLQSSQSSLLAGNVTITGFSNAVRLRQFPNISFINPLRPTRSGNRSTQNITIDPITVIVPFGSAIPMAFQALCNGNNLGTITITELISQGKTSQPLRVVKLTNAYLIEWAIEGDRDGGVGTLTFTYDGFNQTRNAIGQDQKAKGKTAASTNVSTQKTS